MSSPILKLVAQRIVLGLLLLLAVSVLIFAGTQILPGDVAQAILGQSATPESLANLRAELGLNDPAYVRYFRWLGGVLTGEHGVGVEKRDLMPAMFSEIDLNQQQRLKCAFDAKGLLNPGKVFPTLHRCAELGRMHVHAGRVAFPDIPRF